MSVLGAFRIYVIFCFGFGCSQIAMTLIAVENAVYKDLAELLVIPPKRIIERAVCGVGNACRVGYAYKIGELVVIFKAVDGGISVLDNYFRYLRHIVFNIWSKETVRYNCVLCYRKGDAVAFNTCVVEDIVCISAVARRF